MSVLMVVRIAFKALGRNKLRTALTMLGMIIGVSAVITMVALGSGAQASIDAQIQSDGTNPPVADELIAASRARRYRAPAATGLRSRAASMIACMNAGRSSGFRLVIRLPSRTTSAST